ncbi:MAG: universal stress protein [Candidatus Limnocylindria bacterium]
MSSNTKENVMTPGTTSLTIVVGYDGSPAARAAVEHAIDRVIPDGRLVLVSAWQVPIDYSGALYYPEMTEEASRQAKHRLESLERDCERLAAVVYECDVVEGSPAVTITRAAESHEADEIIVGSRGVGRVRALLGSVAHDVIHLAQCPVTVIPERLVDSRTGTAAAAAGAV